MTNPAIPCLDSWLSSRLSASASAWLHQQLTAIAAQDSTALALAFSAAGRQSGTGNLALNDAEKQNANTCCPGWNPSAWSLAQAVRTRLILAMPDSDAAWWWTTIEKLFATASVDELVALYQMVSLMPFAELLRERAAEGLRSSMQSVFVAMALNNPFPAAQLGQDAFNQMVLKAFFTSADIDQIHDLKRRANRDLSRMLCDYARERRAASRTVDARLWTVVGWCVDDDAHAALQQATQNGSPEEQLAARAVLASPTMYGTSL